MTVQNEIPENTFTATGDNEFQLDYYVHEIEELLVTLNGVVVNPNLYTVQFGTLQDYNGAKVIFEVPITGTLVITRNTSLERVSSYNNTMNNINASNLNNDFDRLYRITQEQALSTDTVNVRVSSLNQEQTASTEAVDARVDKEIQDRYDADLAIRGYVAGLALGIDPVDLKLPLLTDIDMSVDNKGKFLTEIDNVDGTPERKFVFMGLNKLDVGLGNVDNTSDVNKPVSAATQTAIDNLNEQLTADIIAVGNDSIGRDDVLNTRISTEEAQRQVEDLILANQIGALANGATRAYLTYAALDAAKATLPTNSFARVTNDPTPANNWLWQWDGTTLTKSARDDLAQANAYADANAVFKPTVNPTEKNINNSVYGVSYYTVAADITLANNFPIASESSYVLTYAVVGSSVKYQRVVLPFANPVRIFDRSFTGTWSVWVEGSTRAYADTQASTQAEAALTSAKAYADANAVFKPTVNPTEKNLDNVPYGVSYYTVAEDITVANNFPIASQLSYVLTYAVTGSSVKYQRVVLPFANPVRIFDRSFTGTWSAWSEGTNKAYVDAVSARLNNNQIFLPVANPADKNIDNLGYSLVLFNNVSDLTPANNFPRAAPSLVFTYTAGGSSTRYQRVVTLETAPRIYDRVKTSEWSGWIESLSATAATVIKSDIASNKTNLNLLEQRTFSIVGTNLLDKAKIVAGEYVSPSTSKIVMSASYLRSDFIPVIEGQSYTQSGVSAGGMTFGWYDVADKAATALSVTTVATGTAPVGAKFVVINIVADAVAKYENTAMLVKGSVTGEYVPYKPLIAQVDIQDAVGRSELLINYSFNMANPAKFVLNRRYSTGSKTIIQDTLLIGRTDHIAVTEGEWYAASGLGLLNVNSPSTMQGGYFSSYGATAAVDNITFVAPVTGAGGVFKVPVGLGITHVVLSINLNEGKTAVTGDVQLERGEMSTAFQPFSEQVKLKPSLYDGSGSGTTPSPSTVFDSAAWHNYVKADGAKIYQDKLPKFRKAMLLKNEDVIVVNTGTSLTARTSEHSNLLSDASTRPPMMHTRAFCSHIWDALKWDGQQYRRYDAVGTFTETGTFATSASLAEWDDDLYRDGLTRYSDSDPSSIAFTVPVNAWQFNFIYRTDSTGCTAKITIAEGASQMQVLDESTGLWVEAHNFEFSMLEAAPITRTVNVPSTIDATTTPVVLASKSNTTYQKRLKMRCRDNAGLDSMATTKAVTISKVGASGRFMYWGVEYSPRQFMVTYINAARGSYNTSALGTRGLPKVQDNEIWGFKPTLILSELAIHNDGASGAGSSPVGHWAGLTYNYIANTSYELSMFSRATFFGLSPEYAFFTASLSWNFDGINEDGSLKFGMQTASAKGAAKMMSGLDKCQEAIQYLRENHPSIVAIDATKHWVDAGYEIFGDLKTATLGSGKGGTTFTNEGSHWNDTGAKIMAKAVIPII